MENTILDIAINIFLLFFYILCIGLFLVGLINLCKMYFDKNKKNLFGLKFIKRQIYNFFFIGLYVFLICLQSLEACVIFNKIINEFN